MDTKKSSIQVEVRINPRLDNAFECGANTLTAGTKTYTFNRIHLTTSQSQIYNKSVRHLTEAFLEGYNCTVMAYGQTGSGKTYTMGITHEDMTGVVPQALRHIFKKSLEITCTFIEVYNEEVIDLFSHHKRPLSLREANGEVIVAGVSEICLRSYEDGIEALSKGSLERTTKSTNMNSKSSRSHAIFTLFYKCEVNGSFVMSKFSFVDLAGSERLKRTLCAGDRAKEGISINSGLLALGNVISALFKRSPHVPFRDSKLTRILQSCLNGYVLMIACVSSSHADMNETHNTLKYASRAASIETSVRMNIQVDGSKFAMLLLKKEIQKLKVENQMLKDRIKRDSQVNVEEVICENRMLKSKIESMGSEKDDKREELSQEILKHPFVQNLIDENQRLNEMVQSICVSRSEVQVCATIAGMADGMQEACRKAKLDDESVDYENNNRREESNERNALDMWSMPESVVLGIEKTQGTDSEKTGVQRDDKENNSRIDTIRKHVDSLEISNTADAANKIEMKQNIEKVHKRAVTFDLERNTKKYALFTPRKEKITMKITIENTITGYLPTVLAFYDSCVVFSSIDNKVRQWGEKVSVLFAEEGIRCMASAETLLYTTRGMLRRFDPRSGTRPVYVFRSEISAVMSSEHYMFTGHEDGTFSMLDDRNSKIVVSEKAHSGTIFSIEKIGEDIYTASRDHTVKCYSDGFLTLSPPHLDSVQGLLSYNGDLVSFGRDCSLKRWRSRSIVKTVPYAHDSWIKCGVAMKDSFVTGSKDGSLRFWDFCDNSVFCVGKVKFEGSINSIAFGEGSSVYVGCQNKEIMAITCKYDT
ncbi:kinesin-like protein [Ordospora pajunii]|uniref:kinesin-like protein n=1 Tax=Ordospora pajunii TaxID=3039483 RepID=UPI0029526AE5|nr:kinesin-like protein [Ordospora pajunii]KAH9412353.1 kinesin-like protein [Ordospora pajunii]